MGRQTFEDEADMFLLGSKQRPESRKLQLLDPEDSEDKVNFDCQNINLRSPSYRKYSSDESSSIIEQ